MSTCASIGRGAARRCWCAPRRRRSLPTSHASWRPARPGGRSPWRAQLDDAILHLRTNEPELGTWILEDRGRRDARARLRRRAADARRSLVRARRARRAAAHACAPRRLLALAVRADRAGLVLRRHAVRTRARGRSQLHARRRGQAPSRCRRSTSTRTRASTGARASSSASTAKVSRSRPRARRSTARSTPRARCGSGSSRRRRTTSTGPTRSASRSKSAPACRPTR